MLGFIALEKEISDGSRFTPEVQRVMQMHHSATSHLRPQTGPVMETYISRGFYFQRCYANLPAVQKKLLEAAGAGGELMVEATTWPDLTKSKMEGTTQKDH